MAVSRVTTWSSGQVLTASALNAEFDNIINNASSLFNPLTATLDLAGFGMTNLIAGSIGSLSLYFNGDSNTGLFRSAADTMDLVGGGARILQLTGSTTAVNYADVRGSAAGGPIVIAAEGTDTNITMQLTPKGTGYVEVPRTVTVGATFYPSIAFPYTSSLGYPRIDGLGSVSADAVDLIAGGKRVLQASFYVDATNYVRVSPSQSGQPVLIESAGADTNIDLRFATAGSGNITAATAFIPAQFNSGSSLTSINTPPAHALVRENVVKGWIAFKGVGTASTYASYNVSTLTDNGGVGDFTITWQRAFAATPYAVVGSCYGNAGATYGFLRPAAPMTTTTTQVLTIQSAGSALADMDYVAVVALGSQ